MWFEILLLLLCIFAYVYWFVTKNFGFFKKLGVEEKPGSFPFGSDSSWKAWTGKMSGIKLYDEMEGEFRDKKYYGFYLFGQKQFVVKDLEIGKLIAIKDAEYFIDRITFGLSHKESKEEVDKLFGLFLTNIQTDTIVYVKSTLLKIDMLCSVHGKVLIDEKEAISRLVRQDCR